MPCCVSIVFAHTLSMFGDPQPCILWRLNLLKPVSVEVLGENEYSLKCISYTRSTKVVRGNNGSGLHEY